MSSLETILSTFLSLCVYHNYFLTIYKLTVPGVQTAKSTSGSSKRSLITRKSILPTGSGTSKPWGKFEKSRGRRHNHSGQSSRETRPKAISSFLNKLGLPRSLLFINQFHTPSSRSRFSTQTTLRSNLK